VPGLNVLLIGPYDPTCGEYTFLSPPLGVWRLAGVLNDAGYHAEVLDPNACDASAEVELERKVAERRWDIIGFSTTGMTLRFDLALAHQARRAAPDAILVAGGMEATFQPQRMFDHGPFHLVVLGEGELPLLDLAGRLTAGADWRGIDGSALLRPDGSMDRRPRNALSRSQLRDAIFLTPYERMPYRRYWERLERAYQVGSLPGKAEREARLAEVRSIRLITLNYCPMGCTFCSSTNFLHSAQDSTAKIARLDENECLRMIQRIVSRFPDARTIIFQDDIFAFRSDARILPLCRALQEAKREGLLPAGLRFISTNRIDAMTEERLDGLAAAGFRVLGFGVEHFSLAVLKEFRKERIYPHIEPMLTAALVRGITPFLDMILTSPRCGLPDLARAIRGAFRWIRAGCEVGMYPYVIPFSGAPMANDATLQSQAVYETHRIAGTDIRLRQATALLPFDAQVREAILEIEASFETRRRSLEGGLLHMPSRLRSLLWVIAAIPALAARGQEAPDLALAISEFTRRLPRAAREGLTGAWRDDVPASVEVAA
jgi:radical SAM superfamily enzyme YgiQ (UPF0313 family)